MRFGLLWFDPQKGRDWQQEVEAAVRRYRERFGRAPTVCYVHPRLLEGKKEMKVGQLRVVAKQTVLPHHFLVMEE